MSRCIGNDVGSKVEVFGASEVLDLDGFEDVTTCQDSMCSTRGDIKSSDRNACLMMGLSFQGCLATRIVSMMCLVSFFSGDLGDLGGF